MAGFRTQRVGGELLAFLAGEVRSIYDPRLEFVTITEVRMTPDLRRATVYWTVPAGTGSAGEKGDRSGEIESDVGCFAGEGRVKEVQEALSEHAKALRGRVGSEMQLKFVPELVFTYDDSLIRGAKIDSLLNDAGFPRREND